MFETKESFNKTTSTNIDSKFATTVSWIDPTDNPENFINKNSQYKKIYLQFLKNNTRTKGLFYLNKQKQIQSETKSFISKSLECRKRAQSFKDKFNQQCKTTNKKRSMSEFKKLNLEIQKIGETLHQNGKLQRKLFFNETRKGIELQEETMLLQYYYKDKDEFAVKNYLKNQRKSAKNGNNHDLDISYLRNHNHSQKKHKRFESNKNQIQSLMLVHDFPYFEKIKKINFIKQEKFQNECFKMAEKNYQWKRQNNFHQMQQIIKLNRQNLLLESISKIASQETIKKEQKFNKTMRFFLKFAYLQKVKRAFYEYIDDQGMEKLISFILQNQFNSKIKEKSLKQILEKIIKHKIEPKIEFYDLMEFIDTINESYSVNILDLVFQKYPHYLTKNQETIINKNMDEIKKQTYPERIPFIIRLIFQSSPQKFVLNQYLPVKAVPKILTHWGITEDDIPREKLFQCLYWNQRRPEGLNYNQFYFSFMMLGVLNNNWRNVYKLLEKIKMNEFTQ